jgi:hypothetical protein
MKKLLQRATEEDTHMADLPPYPNTGNDTALRPDQWSDPSTPPSTPRWVKVFGIIFIILVLLIIILHLAGFSFGGHGGGHTPSARVIEYGMQQL